MSQKLDILMLYSESLVRAKESVVREIGEINETLQSDDELALRTLARKQASEERDSVTEMMPLPAKEIRKLERKISIRSKSFLERTTSMSSTDTPDCQVQKKTSKVTFR